MEIDNKQLEGQNLESEVSKTVGLSIYLDTNEAMKLAQNGDQTIDSLSDKERTKVRGLNELIKVFQRKIDYMYSPIKEKKHSEWKRKFRRDEDKEDNPFDEWAEDILLLEEIDKTLGKYQQEIDLARRTVTEDDDFVTASEDEHQNKKYYVNKKYYATLEDLRTIGRELESIMIRNGLRMYKKEDENPEDTLLEMTDERLAFS